MEADLCLSGMNYTETYIKENDRLLEMKTYHEYNTHTSQQEEQMEKYINERAQTMRQA